MNFLSQYPALEKLLYAISLILGSTCIHFLLRIILLPVIKKITSHTRYQWDDILIKKKIPEKTIALVPGFLVYYGAAVIPDFKTPLERLSFTYIVLLITWIIHQVIWFLHEAYSRKEIAKKWPLTGIIQTMELILFIFAGIISFSAILGKSPAVLLGSFGAIAAILTFAFRETILSFVSGILIQINGIFRVGDWIEMPQYSADGDLIELGLHTAKVQNWDKTITTIPTYKLITEAVKNWRGMQETGGRRIKRSIYIDQTSIRFCDENLLNRLSKITLIQKHIQDKTQEIVEHNKLKDASHIANTRCMTNIGLFRAYIFQYLKKHPRVHQELTLLVRHLQPKADQGLPIEIYCFTNDIRWLTYEEIQADIFDHIYAILKEFDLKPFQRSSSFYQASV